MKIHATNLLVGQDWRTDCRITCIEGRISAIETGVAPAGGDYRVDTLLPALANLHSHSFQRAMAGMTDVRHDRCPA